MLEIISSVLFGSSLSRLITSKIVSVLGLNFFQKGIDSNIPSLSPDMAVIKSQDLLGAVLVFSLSILFYLFLLARQKLTKPKNTVYLKYLDLFFFSLVFIQSHFVTTSLLITLLTVIGYLFFSTLLFRYHLVIKLRHDFPAISSGLVVGIIVFIILRQFSTSLVLPATVSLLSALFLSQTLTFRLNSLYPFLLIVLFIYNFRYWVGNLDTIEEGFWLAWFQRLNAGEALYRDFWVYHQPLLIWLGSWFIGLFGSTVANVRLFFHLLQIVSFFLIYSASTHLIKTKSARFFFTARKPRIKRQRR